MTYSSGWLTWLVGLRCVALFSVGQPVRPESCLCAPFEARKGRTHSVRVQQNITIATVASSRASSPSSSDLASSPQQLQQEQQESAHSSTPPSVVTRTRLASQVPELSLRGQPSSTSSFSDGLKRIRLDPLPPSPSSHIDSADMKPEADSYPHQNGTHATSTEVTNGGASTSMIVDNQENDAITPSGFSRHELVRLMVQSLQSLGYKYVCPLL